VTQYLATIPADRRVAISAVPQAINDNLPKGFEDRMHFCGFFYRLSPPTC